MTESTPTLADLIDQRRSSVDVRPLRLVADCYLTACRKTVEPMES